MKSQQELTRAELEVMKILWQCPQGAFVSELIDRMPAPKPAYNTVSTIIRILERKGIVGHTAIPSHRYHPLIDKPTYTRSAMQGMMHHFFDNSPGAMLSFFLDNENLTLDQIEQLRKMVDKIGIEK